MFQPGSAAELASVADDSALLLWDTRSGTGPVLRVADAHGTGDAGPLDLHVVDWNPLRPELLATGGTLVVKAVSCESGTLRGLSFSPRGSCRRTARSEGGRSEGVTPVSHANTHRSCQPLVCGVVVVVAKFQSPWSVMFTAAQAPQPVSFVLRWSPCCECLCQREPLPTTGASDGSVRVWDRRRMGGVGAQSLHSFGLHTGAVMRVEWSPQVGSALQSQHPFWALLPAMAVACIAAAW